MSQGVAKTKRPVSIIVISAVGFLGCLISIPMIFSSMAKAIGDWYPPYLAMCVVVVLVCMVGLWMMKKWAVFVYTGLTGLNQVVSLL